MIRKNPTRSKKKIVVGAIVALAVIAVVLVALQLAHVTHFFAKSKPAKPAVTASQYTKGEPKPTSGTSTGTANNSGSNSTSSTDKANGATGTGTAGSGTTTTPTPNGPPPIAPNGNYVNSHEVSLSNSNSMTSDCTTSVGATCQITFTMVGMSSMVKSLPAQTTDAGGATYWNWKLQDYGLTAGTWKITAIAKLNGQTQTATDATNLEISQ